MSPRHHLDPATVVSYAAGALSPELAAVAATHLDVCAECRRSVARAEAVGGTLICQQQPVATPRQAQLRADILEQLGPQASSACAEEAMSNG